MTINGGQPHRVGYQGQRYRIVVDTVAASGGTNPYRIGWTNDNTRDLSPFNQHYPWTNARYEEVTPDDSEMLEWLSQ